MEESKFSQSIFDKFMSDFPEGWIELLDWSDGEKKKSLVAGVTKIKSFVPFLFSNASKLVLSGDFLVGDINKLTDIDSMIEKGLQDSVPDDKRFQTKLMIAYSDMLYNMHDAIKMLRYHVSLVKDRLGVQSKSLVFSAIFLGEVDRSKNEYIELFDLVCDVCFMEYRFSYDENYIQKLLVIKEIFEKKYKEKSDEIKAIIDACLTKVELLLSKLSIFSKQKQITYNYNFELKIITLSDPEKYQSNDFRHLYLKYMDPSRLDYSQIMEWQKNSYKKDVAMWQLAFLMRYYTKITKSQEQIDSLISLGEKHHLEYIKGKEHNLINDCADRSFRNYMYNSRLSFILGNNKGLNLQKVEKEIAKIESIQNETFIFNYHPYQKVVEYLCAKIDDLLKEDTIVRDIEAYNSLLQKCYCKLKENYEWCKHHQPYLMQLRYNFSTIKDEANDIKIFCPSSFCRPLRFEVLKERIEQLNIKVSMLDYQVRHIDEHRDLIRAKNKIESMERKNLEQMGLFASVTTFLVGLLSIFIGNTNTSIADKMGYVIALGLILLSFVCLGYFLVSERFKKAKPWIFGIVGILFLIALGIFVLSLINGSNDIKENSEIEQSVPKELKVTTEKIQDCFVFPQSDTKQAVMLPQQE